MKNVFLIGDSIRFGNPPTSPGYGVYVKEKLKGVAEVYAPDENSRFAQFTLRQLFEWKQALGDTEIDVIHWNNGLWDVLRLHGDEPLTPIDMYVTMLERIHKKLKLLFPKAKIIFATSTAVLEEKCRADFARRNSDIEEYNEAAKKLMNKLGVEVNDLYEITKSFGEEMHCDWVHFNDEGSEILADAVVAKIKKAL